ncbi:MAG: hypothetical protein QF479_04170 [Candidatus Poseidoniaceae archaeon]|nr:hypothetical protein [Candidatus Poseidoniaceae archaeon]
MAGNRFAVRSSAFGLIILMIMMTLTPLAEEFQLDENEIMKASGRQLDDIDCSGYTFEDLFDYNFALFNIDIEDDWATSSMDATAYVNGSNSATVRENLDSLFDGAPGGNNSWLSTDEREAVREIGPKCIEDMDTRLGLREGIPHRGGVDWNDFEFVEEGIALDEVNLVPNGHSEERNCQNLLASSNCTEVPVTVTDDLQISLFVKNGESHNMRFNQLPNQGDSNFTLALNVTNMTNANLMLTFPVLQGLRIANFSMRDDGVEINSFEPEEIYLPDGRLRVSQQVDYDKADWPIGRNLFIDFTTSPPESNDIPQWTGAAPSDNTIIPIMNGGEYSAVLGDVISTWASDTNGWNLECTFADSGWSSSQNQDGDLLVTSPSGTATTTAECAIKDPFGAQNNDTLTFTFGQPFTATGEITDGENVDFTLTPTGLVSELSVSAHAHQMQIMGTTRTISITNAPATISLPMEGLRPGSVMVMGGAQNSNMLDFNFMLDFGLEKVSLPPVLELKVNFDGKNGTWDASGLKFTLKGEVIDPDGETVSLSLTLCESTASDFTRVGKNWEIDVSIATCVQQQITVYDVTITATDESGVESSLTVNVKDPYANDDNSQIITDDDSGDSESSGLPSVSLMATLTVTLLGAAFARRKLE